MRELTDTISYKNSNYNAYTVMGSRDTIKETPKTKLTQFDEEDKRCHTIVNTEKYFDNLVGLIEECARDLDADIITEL